MKKNLFILSLVFSAVLGINSALAAEEVVYYDTTSLDTIFEKYPDLNHKNKNTKKLEDKKSIQKESESQKEGLLTNTYHYKEDGSLAKGLVDTGDVRRYFDKETGQMVKNKKIENENIFVDAEGEVHYMGWDYYKGKLGFYDPQKATPKVLRLLIILPTVLMKMGLSLGSKIGFLTGQISILTITAKRLRLTGHILKAGLATSIILKMASLLKALSQ